MLLHGPIVAAASALWSYDVILPFVFMRFLLLLYAQICINALLLAFKILLFLVFKPFIGFYMAHITKRQFIIIPSQAAFYPYALIYQYLAPIFAFA